MPKAGSTTRFRQTSGKLATIVVNNRNSSFRENIENENENVIGCRGPRRDELDFRIASRRKERQKPVSIMSGLVMARARVSCQPVHIVCAAMTVVIDPVAATNTEHPDPSHVLAQLAEVVGPTFADAPEAMLHMRAASLFARLKAMNRVANAAVRASKQATTEARAEMDATNLGLQNLLYEKRHLEREIEKCRQFA